MLESANTPYYFIIPPNVGAELKFEGRENLYVLFLMRELAYAISSYFLLLNSDFGIPQGFSRSLA